MFSYQTRGPIRMCCINRPLVNPVTSSMRANFARHRVDLRDVFVSVAASMASNRCPRLLKILTGTSCGDGEELLQLEGKLERTAHFWTLVVRHFVRNRCLIRASALAYTTLLALIPLLA